MDCPWYLGFQATEESRDNSICPESASENDDFDVM